MPKKPIVGKGDQNEMKTVLMKKYRDLLLEKMTEEDPDELRYYLTRQYDKEHGWNDECRKRFEQILRTFMHEEILRREIAGIETLLQLLSYEDIRKKGAHKTSRKFFHEVPKRQEEESYMAIS
jgi:hypothetical protein